MSVPRTTSARSGERVFERRKKYRRPQVGVRAQLAPDAQQSRLRAQMAGIVIERRSAHGAQQHGSRCKARLQRVGRQRIVHRTQCGTANQFLLKFELMTEPLGYGPQNKHGLFSDFRTNAVAGEDGEFQEHAGFGDLAIGRFRRFNSSFTDQEESGDPIPCNGSITNLPMTQFF